MCFAVGSQHQRCRGSQPKHISNPDSATKKPHCHKAQCVLLNYNVPTSLNKPHYTFRPELRCCRRHCLSCHPSGIVHPLPFLSPKRHCTPTAFPVTQAALYTHCLSCHPSTPTAFPVTQARPLLNASLQLLFPIVLLKGILTARCVLPHKKQYIFAFGEKADFSNSPMGEQTPHGDGLSPCVQTLFWLVLRPRGCTQDLVRSLRSRGSIHCQYRLAHILRFTKAMIIFFKGFNLSGCKTLFSFFLC